ncbi:MAG TPA: aldehyde dehydrogenase [Hypericibacter adhaerens]|jgi:5-carboxymethyl-2-hydroxymuconic-semialdehyde dehydrogenase|uniref:5-carboxymethyl-2-hydroxymuconate semialdehyde dehydrogenase n=1 Tax=Hypericibacter adhaerens TaxID=2602016 RepID=A0A5J6MZ39_9PROT|nr:aldehyde dehydrogenase [Hypericibacter adhaerens]QEX23028.1 5-carboxymethyl-2-hydroxymuconate semialdehyde dehydrogenase [Hypericibacter adhaerens]HWA44240.1 aldehyde dehydrogenase [Hypericibacter adhaerens]
MSARVEGVEIDTRHWIGGRRIDSADRFQSISPIDETPIAALARGGAAEVDLAVAAADRAFKGWSRTSREERARLLHKIADLVEARVESLAVVETRDNGSLLRSHRRGVMPRVAMNFRFFADWLLQLEHPDFEVRNHRNHVSWDPSGVAAIITPWNAPLMLGTWRIAPALAAGCTVVYKPPEWAPLTASLLADITAEAGLPEGVFNVVQGIGREAGAALASHPKIRRLSFTGSVATAKLIAASASQNLVPLSFELGGKSPYLVFADADLDLAVNTAVGQYDNAGQVCLAGTRLLVEASIRDRFLEAFMAKARAVRQGDPRDETTDIGPQISRPHFERVDGYVRRALDAGLKPALGGGPNKELGGLYYRPTLFVDPPPGSEILREEVFGPVLCLQSFRDEAEAIAMANDTDYGLAAIIMTGDETRAERVTSQVSAGLVWNNCFFVRDLRQAFGGNGKSGIGREGGTWSFDFYCDVKNSVFAPNGWRKHG